MSDSSFAATVGFARFFDVVTDDWRRETLDLPHVDLPPHFHLPPANRLPEHDDEGEARAGKRQPVKWHDKGLDYFLRKLGPQPANKPQPR